MDPDLIDFEFIDMRPQRPVYMPKRPVVQCSQVAEITVLFLLLMFSWTLMLDIVF